MTRLLNGLRAEQNLVTQINWVLLFRIILYSALLLSNYFLIETGDDNITLPQPYPLLFLLSIYAFSIYSAVHLLKWPHNIEKFGFIQIIMDTFLAAIFVFMTGASYSVFISIFFFPIITGVLIFPGMKGLSQAGLATLLYGGILYLEYQQILPSYIPQEALSPFHTSFMLIHSFATQGLLFFLVAFLSFLLRLRLKKVEDELVSSKKAYQELVELHSHIYENINSGIISLSPDYHITSINRAGAKTLGVKRRNAIGTEIRTIIPNFNPETRYDHVKIDFLKKDEPIILRMSTTLFDASGKENPHANNQILVFKDVTAIEKLAHQLRQSEKLAAIGTMSASIAHDFRNPLTAILGCSQVLEQDLLTGQGDIKSQSDLIGIIEKESSRLLKTISNFLYFAKPNTPHFSWFSLTDCFGEALDSCQKSNTWPKTCKVDIDIDKLLDIYADQEQLYTIFIHLLENAMAFSPKGEEKIYIGAREIKNNTGEGIEIIFEDNGTGIKEEERKKLFDPFYTNRADGTGLGLSLTQQYIIGHGGTISCGDSRMLSGASFTLFFPLP